MDSSYRDRFGAWLAGVGAATRTIPELLEGLTKRLGETVLCSEDFARLAGTPMRDHGRVALKGIALPIGIHAPLEAVSRC